MHTIVYSLNTSETLPTLEISLGLKIVHESPHSVQMHLDAGVVNISKYDYINKMKVYQSGKQFFILCTKSVSRESAFDCLMKHLLKKIDARIEVLNDLKSKYEKELVA